MAQVTVQQLAEVVGASAERLLTQMKEAGLPHSAAEEAVSDEDKQTLLKHLKRSHGEPADAPKRITLKRKTLSTLRTSGSQGKKTVNVEVRKKRTYVKRDPDNPDDLPEEDIEALEAEEIEVPETAEVAPPEPEVPEPVVEEPEEDESNLDPEVLRQRAASRRKAQEEREAAERQAAAEARKADADAKAAVEENKTTKESGAKRPKRLHEAPSTQPKSEDRRKPRSKLARNAPSGRGKQRSHNLSLADIESETGITRRRGGRKKLKSAHAEHSKHGFEMPTEQKIHEVELLDTISVADLAQQMSVKSGAVIKELMKLGVMATINQMIDQDTATLIVEELGHAVRLVSSDALEESLEETLSQHEGVEESRAPVVTVMGHVDHGKTSLLDYIRKSQVADGEAGGITQHIGAYHVDTDHGMVSFLDTPGHAAFTAMRARGAKSTDIVILVVAADDGVMPQTEEAVNHAQAAGVPIIVAVNKIDKEGADVEKIKGELAAKEVVPEDWGGDVQFINVSAQTGEGIPELLDAVLLQAELLELTAARDVPAQGIVIESRLDKGRGPVASLLVQSGTLNKGDIVLAGLQFGRVRAMLDENAVPIDTAGPSIPVEILGLDSTPAAGDIFAVVESEKRAREVADFRQEKSRNTKLQRQQAAKLDNMFENMTAMDKKSLNVVIKADVRGSLEAIQSALLDLGNDEVLVNIVSGGVGGITETDINLAVTSSAVVFGFNVRADNAARAVVESEAVDLRYYNVIYDLIDDVKAALTGMLAPELREEIVGIAEVRDVFRSPKFGQVAGCMVTEGTVYRAKPIRVLRDSVVIYEGELESLRRFKDDASDVRNGMECGIGVKNYTDVKVGDLIEVFEVKEIARSL
ncbi:MAG: translation initiation factor IF-2 [Halieaceae bacterium]|nr:translation initiation factor IF-2 [Halieaceae bacterium]MCP4466861.1 translation initiation factor IF-2 [Halieaceae bacterium]